MAQRAIIGINGDLMPFDDTLDKIQTQGIGGGSVTWVPEAGTRCETLRVTANGSYSAATAGVYGWDNVLVSVPGSSVTGKDPDTGEEVEVHPDPDTGEIVKTVIPEEIRVTTLPTKTTYAMGETIDYTGIVVHGYSSTGRDLGAIPFSELIFPVTTAQGGDDWTDGQGLNAKMLYYTPHVYIDGQGHELIRYVHTPALGRYYYEFAHAYLPVSYGSKNSPATILVTRYGKNYAMSVGETSADVNLFADKPDTDHDGKGYGWDSVGGTSEKATVGHFSLISFEKECTEIPVSTVDPTTVDPTNLYAVQSLPVQWLRTGDGAILETSFGISVTGGNT